MWQGMVDARPAPAARPVVGSKKNATFLASTVRQQALPLADRVRYPPTVEGMLAAHPADAPELYCFYKFCVPAAPVPVQLLPPLRPPGTKVACLPHASDEYAWAATDDGRVTAGRSSAYPRSNRPWGARRPRTPIPYLSPRRRRRPSYRLGPRPRVPRGATPTAVTPAARGRSWGSSSIWSPTSIRRGRRRRGRPASPHHLRGSNPRPMPERSGRFRRRAGRVGHFCAGPGLRRQPAVARVYKAPGGGSARGPDARTSLCEGRGLG